jgi:hypothetical protein
MENVIWKMENKNCKNFASLLNSYFNRLSLITPSRVESSDQFKIR